MLLVVTRDIVKFAIVASGLFIAGCSASDAESAKPQNAEAVAKTQAVQDAAVQGEPVRAPLNCPVMIVAYSHSYDKASADILNLSYEPYLSFRFQKNPNFNANQGDECNGDLKKLWNDLTRFEAQIKAHFPRISHISDLSYPLRNFPLTQEEMKRFIDNEAKANSLSEKLGHPDRSSLDSVLEFNKTLVTFVREKERAYWQNEQGPIIENIFSEYNLKMWRYSSEKTSYFYHPAKKQGGGLPSWEKSLEGTYELEYLGSVFSAFEFERRPD